MPSCKEVISRILIKRYGILKETKIEDKFFLDRSVTQPPFITDNLEGALSQENEVDAVLKVEEE